MKIPLPHQLPPDPITAYRSGWMDAIRSFSAKGGKAATEAKAAASRANGAKGGRPRKQAKES